MHLGIGFLRTREREQVCQCPFRTNVQDFDAIQLLHRFDIGLHGHKAMEAARVIGSILVLCSAVHDSSKPQKEI